MMATGPGGSQELRRGMSFREPHRPLLRLWFGRCGPVTVLLLVVLGLLNVALLSRVLSGNCYKLPESDNLSEALQELGAGEDSCEQQKERAAAGAAGCLPCAACATGGGAVAPPPPEPACPACPAAGGDGFSAAARAAGVAAAPAGEVAPFILHRVIGNDLPPLQSPGQLYNNVKYILEHEPELPGCEKRWVINFMVNDTERGLLLDLFQEHGYKDRHVVMRRVDRGALAGLNETNWPRYEPAVIALNGGRRAALADGFAAGARWVLPLDASQFLTREAWNGFLHTAEEAEERGYRYIKMPMFRLRQEQSARWLHGGTNRFHVLKFAPMKGESQLIFRNDSTQWFNESAVFGYRDKLQLLYDVCGRLRSKGNCGCGDAYPELLEGMDGWNRTVPRYPAIMKRCGYGVRLYSFPCKEPNLEETIASINLRPLVRIEGRQRLMFYAMGKLRTFEEMCGRRKFTIRPEQIIYDHHKLMLCQPWGEVDCAKLRRKGRRRGEHLPSDGASGAASDGSAALPAAPPPP